MDGPLLKKKFRKETTGMGLIHSYFLSGNKSVFIIWKSHSATWIYPLSWHALCYDLVKFFLLSNSLWRWRQIARGQELIPQKQTWLFLYQSQANGLENWSPFYALHFIVCITWTCRPPTSLSHCREMISSNHFYCITFLRYPRKLARVDKFFLEFCHVSLEKVIWTTKNNYIKDWYAMHDILILQEPRAEYLDLHFAWVPKMGWGIVPPKMIQLWNSYQDCFSQNDSRLNISSSDFFFLNSFSLK